jgi:hypothetical protein
MSRRVWSAPDLGLSTGFTGDVAGHGDRTSAEGSGSLGRVASAADVSTVVRVGHIAGTTSYTSIEPPASSSGQPLARAAALSMLSAARIE